MMSDLGYECGNDRRPPRVGPVVRGRYLSCLLVTVCAGAWSGRADAAKAETTGGGTDVTSISLAEFENAISRRTLPNGLRVVLDHDQTTPTVAVSVTYAVGSSSESAGQSGFAHLFEHLMFQGSKHATKGQHFKLISERGGVLNGTTDSDRTNYFEELPANELALALWLEADRMRWLALTPENFENQRAVVEEEYRMRVQNQPYAVGGIRLAALVFEGYPPYAHPTIGSMADLGAAKFEWVKAFHDQHYAPNNAVLTIAGDFDPARALALVDDYFGPAARGDVAPLTLPPAPEQPKGGHATVRDDNARTPAVLLGFPIPPARTPDHYALEVASMVLAGGESSRLYRTLVHDRAVASEVGAGTDDHRGPDQLSLTAVLTDKGRLPEVEAALESAIARLAAAPPSAAELERVKQRLRTQFLFGLQTNLARAVQLGEFETLYGDARLLPGELARYVAVTPEDVRRAVARWLTPERRSLVEVLPGAKETTQ
jgi:zinc protease